VPAIARALAIVLVLLAVSADRATAATILVDFEGGSAPCLFQDTTALRTLPGAPGLAFAAAEPLGGGAVLAGCANFGVLPRSGDHFLAFNRGLGYSDGGTPTDPQSLVLDRAASRVSVWASGGRGGTSFLMEAFDASGGLVASDDEIVVGGTWAMLEIEAGAIFSVRLRETGSDNSFAFDDFSYDTIPEPASGLLLALALVAARRLGAARRARPA